jgi:hypothetical protein
MSENLETSVATVDRNYLIMQIARERVLSRGGNPANQEVMKASLKEVERELADVN